MQFEKPRGIFGLVAAALTGAYDPDRDARVAKYVAHIERIISVQKRSFSFASAVVDLEISDYDRPFVAEKLYQQFLVRAWTDNELTDNETELLKWAATNLGLPDTKTAALNTTAAMHVFRQTFGHAIANGAINQREEEHLSRIAARCGTTVASIMTSTMKQEGEAFIRNVFSKLAATGSLREDQWKTVVDNAERLGIPHQTILQVIRTPARKLVEHTLADARSDGVITSEEEATIEFLLKKTIDDPSFRTYVRDAVAETKLMSNIARGILPTIAAPQGVSLRAGELIHWEGDVHYNRTRETASGPKTTTLNGHGVITDCRLIFSSQQSSFQISHSKVLGHRRFGDFLEVRTSSKWAGTYQLNDGRHLAAQIWQIAIGRANQTIVAKDDSQPSRHIPRDVRQRVWQNYGGQCAECRSESYLEFDHIVPVAKGGSNSDSNVQLLCRKCNLAKSDRI